MLYFHCKNSDGTIVSGGIAPTVELAQLQAPPADQTLIIVPDRSIDFPFSENPNFSALKTYLGNQIDASVGAIRQQYITDVPGQSETYAKKEAEARAWTDGDETAHPEKYPFMLAEAAVRSVPIAQVQSEIMAQVNALTPIAAAIEAHRIAAKAAVQAASTLPAIMTAATVDWAAVATAAATA